jgi:hypothetical protein
MASPYLGRKIERREKMTSGHKRCIHHVVRDPHDDPVYLKCVPG